MAEIEPRAGNVYSQHLLAILRLFNRDKRSPSEAVDLLETIACERRCTSSIPRRRVADLNPEELNTLERIIGILERAQEIDIHQFDSPSLQNYAREAYSRFSSFTPARRDELHHAVRRSDVILLGDYHSDKESKYIVPKGRDMSPLILYESSSEKAVPAIVEALKV